MARGISLLALCAALAACTGGGKTLVATVTTGACEDSPYGPPGPAADTAAPDPVAISAEVEGATIQLHLDNLVANCCPSPGADVAIEDATITVRFADVTADEACGCECVTDFVVDIPEVPAGSYTLDVLFNDASLGSLAVTVAGE